ncbi:zinc finger protein [Musa troglodytarum]|uniref:Zinc finger protein n=1 Tax=Musa troglodytarum TaxID=320322 RepID=A0A9E7HIC6_9LILI|nr:zinc finger protein [Musa troglodytarum]
MKVEGSPSCESCRSAPSTVYCRADAAALCAACDASIHSANLLARRHHRVPVLPAVAGGGLVVRPSLTLPYHIGVPVGLDESEREDDEEEEAASWLLLDPVKSNGQGAAALPPFAEVDEFLDLVGYNAGENQGLECCNGPKQQQQLQYSHEKSEESECLVPNELHQHQQSLQMEHDASNGLNYPVSLSTMDASVVPDTSNTSHVRASKGTIDLFSGHHPVPPGFDPTDREARVMRYREKRKARKFEKTVRYASRKAYAETRPRIKGRFAKKSDVELEVDQMLSAAVLADSSFGVVPSF